MVRILKWLAGGVVALLLFAVAVYLASRAMGPTKVEREALALVDAPPVYAGRDGFAALYTVAREVPAAAQARVLAEDVRRFAARPPALGASQPWHGTLEQWPELAAARAGDPAWCALREPGCLERMRAAPAAYAGLLQHNAVLLDRAAALAEWGHFRNPFPPRVDTPIPAYQPMTRLVTRAASRFVSGDADAGLAGACSGVLQGRRLVEAGDSLIGSMIGAALVEGNATLLAEMLAELPRTHALPKQCGDAFARPLALEQGACRMMLAEGRLVTAGLRSQVITPAMAAAPAGNELRKWGGRLLFDPERTAARGAPTFAWYCGEQARALLAQDRALRNAAPSPSRWSLACASNPVGCVLADIAAPAYADYGPRLQDADARLRTVSALLRLRDHDGTIDAAALSRLPVPLRSPARPFQLDLAAGTLGTALYEKPRPGPQGHGGTWSVPLPASRLQASGASP